MYAAAFLTIIADKMHIQHIFLKTVMSSKERVHLGIDQVSGTIVAPDEPKDWDLEHPRMWLFFSKLKGVKFQGGGIIDGSGSKWWAASCKITKTNVRDNLSSIFMFLLFCAICFFLTCSLFLFCLFAAMQRGSHGMIFLDASLVGLLWMDFSCMHGKIMLSLNHFSWSKGPLVEIFPMKLNGNCL